jgi:hypothetical protein
VLGVVVLSLVSYALFIAPRLRQGSWISHVPTNALIVILPQVQPTTPMMMYVGGPSPNPPLGEAIYNELEARARHNKLSSRQWRMLISQCETGPETPSAPGAPWSPRYPHLADLAEQRNERRIALLRPLLSHLRAEVVSQRSYPDGAHHLVRFRVVGWSAELSTRVRLTPGASGGEVPIAIGPGSPGKNSEFYQWGDDVSDFGPAPRSGAEYNAIIEADDGFGWQEVAHHPIVIRFAPSVPLWGLRAESSADTERAIGACEVTLRRDAVPGHPPRAIVRFTDLWPAVEAFDRSGTGVFAIRLEVLHDGHAVGSATAWWSATVQTGTAQYRPGGQNGAGIPGNAVVLEETSLELWSPNSRGVWQLRITGDPSVAQRDFGADHYWQGQVTIPLLIIPSPGQPGWDRP